MQGSRRELRRVVRVNDSIAFGYNWAQSFRISTGEGADTVPSAKSRACRRRRQRDFPRSSPFRDTSGRHRRRINVVKYHNYRPNDRFATGANIQVRETELARNFSRRRSIRQWPMTIRQRPTDGYEYEMTTNLTRNWRLNLNVGTNKVITEDRAPLLHEFQAEAKKLGKPTPLLDDFLTDDSGRRAERRLQPSPRQ
jgi:hypothetical protein